MSTYKLSDVTALNGNPVVQINNSDSVLGAVPGSMVQIGTEQIVFLDSVDIDNSQITLTAPWPYADAVNAECTIAPITAVSSLISVSNTIKELLAAFQLQQQKYLVYSFNSIQEALGTIVGEDYRLNSEFSISGYAPDSLLGANRFSLRYTPVLSNRPTEDFGRCFYLGETGYYLYSLYEDLYPEHYGVARTNDGSDTAAMQQYFDNNAVCKLGRGITYVVDNLLIPNKVNWKLDLNKSTLKKSSNGDSYYLLASYKHINNVTEAQAPCEINNGVLDANNIAQHPLITQNWNSEFDLESKGGLGAGVLFAAETRAGQQFPSSSLVNTRFKIISHHNGGCGIWVKDSAQNNATDGTILPGSQFYQNGDMAVYIEAGAGWDVQCRTYANGGGIFFKSHGKGTLLHDSYIDDGKAGLIDALPESGQTRSIAVKGERVLGSNNVGLLPIYNCNIHGEVTHAGLGDSPPWGVLSKSNTYGETGYIWHDFFAPPRWMVSVDDEFLAEKPFQYRSGASTGRYRVRNAQLHYYGTTVSGEWDNNTDGAYWFTYCHLDTYNGNAKILPAGNPFELSVSVPPLNNYSARTATIRAFTKDNYTGNTRVKFESIISVISKQAGVDAWRIVHEYKLYDASDWITPPTVSITDTGDHFGMVTINAEQSAESGYGQLNVIWQS